MPAWSPILIQKIEIHALGFVLRKLQLNRHLEAEVKPHQHDYAQLILYLAGEGAQIVNRRKRKALLLCQQRYLRRTKRGAQGSS